MPQRSWRMGGNGSGSPSATLPPGMAVAQHGAGSGLIPVPWLAAGPLLASLVLPARITAALAGWSTLPGLALIADQPGGPGMLAPHLSARAARRVRRRQLLLQIDGRGRVHPAGAVAAAGATPPRAVSMTSRTNRSFSGA